MFSCHAYYENDLSKKFPTLYIHIQLSHHSCISINYYCNNFVLAGSTIGIIIVGNL